VRRSASQPPQRVERGGEHQLDARRRRSRARSPRSPRTRPAARPELPQRGGRGHGRAWRAAHQSKCQLIATTIACRWVGWAQGRPGMAKNAGSTARIGVARSGLWWKPWGQREIMRSWGTSVGAHRRWTHACDAGRQTTPSETRRWAQFWGSGIQTGGWRAFLDEVSKDLEDLRGVGDHDGQRWTRSSAVYSITLWQDGRKSSTRCFVPLRTRTSTSGSCVPF